MSESSKAQFVGKDSQPEPQLDLRAGAAYKKGLNLANLGRHEEALQYYDKALEFDPAW